MPIYLDHAATSWPKAPGVAEAMGAALDIAGSPGRGGSRGSAEAARIAEDLRVALAATINAADPRRIVLTTGATDGLNLAIRGVVAASWLRGVDPLIVTTALEHNAVRRTLLDIQLRGDGDVREVKVDRDGRCDPLRFVQACGHAALAVVSWASNVTGAIQPVEAIARELKRTDTLLLVDASQTAGLIRPALQLEECGIDLLAFSGHKALAGPPGVGALYVGPRAHPLDLRDSIDHSARIWPMAAGGTGGEATGGFMPRELPGRFEAGTPNTPARAGLLVAARHHEGGTGHLEHARGLMARLVSELRPAPAGLRWFGPREPQERVGIASFTMDGYTPEEVAAVLEAEFGIIVRAGLHCAPGLHEAMGTAQAGGVVRASVGRTTAERDIDALADAIRRLAGAP